MMLFLTDQYAYLIKLLNNNKIYENVSKVLFLESEKKPQT